MTYTHQKRPYRAVAIQWTETNFLDIMNLLHMAEVQTAIHEPSYIMIRDGKGMIETLHPGMWVVRGENGAVKCYTDAQFKIKYEPIIS